MNEGPIKCRPALDSDRNLSSRLFLLTKLISDVYCVQSDPFPNPPHGIVVDVNLSDQLPAAEPQRTETILSKCEEVCRAVSEALSDTFRNPCMTVRGECVQVLVQLTEVQSVHRSFGYVESSVAGRWLPKLHGFAFDCLGILIQLSPASFLSVALRPLHTAVKLLSARDVRKDLDEAATYSELYGKLYRFLIFMLDDTLLADLFSPGIVRDVADCAVRDISEVSSVNLQHSATLCITVLLQENASQLKADTKNEIFTALVLAVQKKIQVYQESSISPLDTQLCLRLLGALTAFILSSSVHVGVLNICSAMFEAGMSVADLDISICCRQGKQILSTILRPRCPKEIFENVRRMDDAATGLVPLLVVNDLYSETFVTDQSMGLQLSTGNVVSTESKRQHEDDSGMERAPKQHRVERMDLDTESGVLPALHEAIIEALSDEHSIETGSSDQNEVVVVSVFDDSTPNELVCETTVECDIAVEIGQDGLERSNVAEEAMELAALFSAAMPDEEEDENV